MTNQALYTRIIQFSGHVLTGASVGGAINPANWSLKRDYNNEQQQQSQSQLLAAHGWTAGHLTAISTHNELLYFHHFSPVSPSSGTAQSAGNKNPADRSSSEFRSPAAIPEGNVTFDCQPSITWMFTAFGREIRLDLTLNKYIYSPSLQIKTISQSTTQVRLVKPLDTDVMCFYQMKRHDSFGTFANNREGFLRYRVLTMTPVITDFSIF